MQLVLAIRRHRGQDRLAHEVVPEPVAGLGAFENSPLDGFLGVGLDLMSRGAQHPHQHIEIELGATDRGGAQERRAPVRAVPQLAPYELADRGWHAR